MVDDFPGTVLNSSIWSTPYNGTSYASQNGWYATNHTVVTPSVLNLQGYTDAAGGGIANGFVGAGLQTTARYPIGLLVQTAFRVDVVPSNGFTPIAIMMGAASAGNPGGWPPENDFLEGGAANLHYTSSNASQGFPLSGPAASALMSGWHVWGTKWTASTISFLVDGVVWASAANPSAGSPTDQYGLNCNNMWVGFNWQTGDPNNPPANAGITSANPYQMQIDWITVDTSS
jgi:hypothetical protein